MAALTRDILGFKYYRADTEGGNRQKCEQMIQVKTSMIKMVPFCDIVNVDSLPFSISHIHNIRLRSEPTQLRFTISSPQARSSLASS